MPAIALNMSIRGQLLSGVRFNPAYLFSSSEPGVWYDPSDLTTLFQDTAGTTPVTAPAQPVGLVLDKSQGLVLGPELVDTANSAVAWIAYGTNTVAQDGDAVQVTFASDAAGAYLFLTQAGGLSSNLVPGKTYQLQVQLRINSGSANFAIYQTSLGNYIDPTSITGPNYVTRVYNFQYVSGSPFIQFANLGAGEVVWIRNISVRELPGFHATQATAASRPTYGIVPRTGRRNLLTFTEQFDNAAWSKPAGTTTITANAALAPDGTTTADLMTASVGNACHYAYQVNSATGSITCTIYAKAGTASWLGISSGFTNGTETAWFDLTNGTVGTVAAGGTATITSAGNGWWRCSHTRSSWTGGGILPFVTNANGVAVFNATGTENILIWGAQLETGSTATAYQRVGSTFDVTEAGVPSLSYLSFDGVDDFLVTPTITPNTDKAQVFAGVRKLADTVSGTIIAELSTTVSNGGAFYLITSANSGYGFGSNGTTLKTALTNTPAAPSTNVLTGIGDISGDIARLRQNGSQSAETLTDQGTGNYLTYPLYIGRRGGTSLPFNGQIYSLIVRFGANLDANTITNTETWVNGKTGAY